LDLKTELVQDAREQYDYITINLSITRQRLNKNGRRITNTTKYSAIIPHMSVQAFRNSIERDNKPKSRVVEKAIRALDITGSAINFYTVDTLIKKVLGKGISKVTFNKVANKMCYHCATKSGIPCYHLKPEYDPLDMAYNLLMRQFEIGRANRIAIAQLG